MLIGEDFLKAEHKYRRELLRDQNQKAKMGSFAKAATLIFVASLMLATCGIPAEDGAAETVEPSATDLAIARDGAPTWEPNRSLLDEILSAQRQTEVLEIGVAADVGVFAGPTWDPDYGRLEKVLNRQFVDQPSGPR